MTARQRTIKNAVEISGTGLHTGEKCGVKLVPAEEDVGILFASGRTEIPALATNVRDTTRGTTLGAGDAEVQTVEHLIAAISGMRVDNVIIEVDGPEVPAADGSALPFVELIQSAGMEEQSAESRIITVKSVVWAADGGKYLLAAPGNTYKTSAYISFAHPMIGEQAISLVVDPAIFKNEIAPARTFCTSAEIEAILSQGLGRGGTKDNVVVAYGDHYSTELRFRDEFVRHKLLDLIGDLSLIGARLLADVTAIKASHTLNVALAGEVVRMESNEWQGG